MFIIKYELKVCVYVGVYHSFENDLEPEYIRSLRFGIINSLLQEYSDRALVKTHMPMLMRCSSRCLGKACDW